MDLDLFPFVELEKTLDETGLGLGPDRDEDPRNGQGGYGSILEVADGERFHSDGAFDAVDDRVEQDMDLFAAELVPAVDEGQTPGVPGQEEGLFEGIVPAAADGDIAPREKGPIAGGAVGDAGTGQPLFARDAQPPVGRARGQNDGPGFVLLLIPFEDERLAGFRDPEDFVGFDAGAERFGLLAEALHQIRGRHAGRKAGVVLDPVGEEDLPAGHPFLQDDRLSARPPGVKGGRQTGRAGADDNDVPGDAHGRIRGAWR